MKCAAWLEVTRHLPLMLLRVLSLVALPGGRFLLPWLGCPASTGLAGSTAGWEAEWVYIAT